MGHNVQASYCWNSKLSGGADGGWGSRYQSPWILLSIWISNTFWWILNDSLVCPPPIWQNTSENKHCKLPERTREEYSGSRNCKKHSIENWKPWKAGIKKQVQHYKQTSNQELFLLHLVSVGYVRVEHTTAHLHLRKRESLNVQENADTFISPKLMLRKIYR